MAKTERLFALLDALRRRRHPVSAAVLADELQVSVRTVYRDVQALASLGVSIEGESGIGYVLGAGFFLPPLMFSDVELEALMLGARWVERLPDPALSEAATNAIGKIAGSVPNGIADKLDAIALFVDPNGAMPDELVTLPAIRDAIRAEQRLAIRYASREARTERTIWPLAIAFYDRPMLAAWCELRADFRTFAIDRMEDARPTGQRIPQSRDKLFREYLSTFAPRDH